MKNELFIPMYIDKVKLFDLNSIICGGFSEFNEITISTDNNSTSKVEGTAGFNLFKINSNLNANTSEEEKNKITGNSKYVQTSASMLANIYCELKNRKVKNEINNCLIGDIVDLNLKFNNNSVLEYLKKMKVLINFANHAAKLDTNSKGNNFSSEIKILDSVISMLDNNTNIVEFTCSDSNYIYVTYLNKEYLYHTQLERIDGHNLNYLAQVVDITDDYNFCNDTVLSEFKGSVIDDVIKSLKALNNPEYFSKAFNLITEVGDKKVVVLDVISISRKNIGS